MSRNCTRLWIINLQKSLPEASELIDAGITNILVPGFKADLVRPGEGGSARACTVPGHALAARAVACSRMARASAVPCSVLCRGLAKRKEGSQHQPSLCTQRAKGHA